MSNKKRDYIIEQTLKHFIQLPDDTLKILREAQVELINGIDKELERRKKDLTGKYFKWEEEGEGDKDGNSSLTTIYIRVEQKLADIGKYRVSRIKKISEKHGTSVLLSVLFESNILMGEDEFSPKFEITEEEYKNFRNTLYDRMDKRDLFFY